MNDNVILAMIVFTIIVIFAIYMEASVWTECRQTNSVFYCLRVLGNR